MRNTPLLQSACLRLNQSIRGLYKHKCHFPKTAPNAVFHLNMFYNLSDVWTEQMAEIATSLLNQFNTPSALLYQISVIRLFSLQQKELAPTSALRSWKPLHDFHYYRYNNIAAHLFLAKQAELALSFRCNEYLANTITGGNKALIDILPIDMLRKHYAIMDKYHLVYQEQVITTDGTSMCTWSQFVKWPFADHISTQRPPRFYQRL